MSRSEHLRRSEHAAGAQPRPNALLFLRPDAVPARWEDRGVSMVMVPLLPEEAAALLDGGGTDPLLEPLDESLARLVAQGCSTHEIAEALCISARTAQRRISALRRRLSATSRGELARLLAARGYAS